MSPGPTIKDIAREADVSSVTVSRVLNAPNLVKPATRERVEAAIGRLGYTPNLAARAMRTRFTRTIGFVVPDILSYSNAAVAQAAERELAAAGYGMMLVSSGYAVEDGLRALETLRIHRVDGTLVYLGHEDEPRLVAALQTLAGPCVVLDRDLPLEADLVLSDHVPAVEEAVGYLVSLGHAAMGLVTPDLRIRPVRERFRAFEAAVRSAGLDMDRQKIVTVRPDERTIFPAENLFDEPPYPTAVFAVGSRLLRSVVEGMRKRDLRMPEDVSVIGFDVEDVAATMTPELTRIDRDYGDIGRTAAEFLLRRLADKDIPRQTIAFESHVRLKGSCAAANPRGS